MQILCRQETIFCTRMNNNKKGAKNSIPNALQQGALSFFSGRKSIMSCKDTLFCLRGKHKPWPSDTFGAKAHKTGRTNVCTIHYMDASALSSGLFSEVQTNSEYSWSPSLATVTLSNPAISSLSIVSNSPS